MSPIHSGVRLISKAAARRAAWVAMVASGIAVGCTAAPTPEARIVQDAAAALGGVEQIRAVRTMTVEGAGDLFALGQGRTIDGPTLKIVVSAYRRDIDFEHGRWREESTQTPAFITGWPDPSSSVSAYDDDVAFDGQGGEASRLDPITARDRRAELYHHPIGFLRAALAPDAKLERARTEGTQDAVDLVTANNERFTLFVDRTTRLPQRVVSKSHVTSLGDVTVSTTIGETIDANSGVNGGVNVKVPGRITTRVDDVVVSDMRIAKATINPSTIPELRAPANARAAPATNPARVTVEEIAPGVWYLTGEFHHSVVAEFADHLTLIEAPIDDTRTLAVIAKARELGRGKPLTQVINTHQHFDHSGGIRAAIAEGLTVITHEGNRRFYEQAAARPATVAPDALAARPKPLAIETVPASDRKVLTDGTRRIEIYPITDSPHSASMLMVYFPVEKLLVEADAYQPPPLKGTPPRIHPFAANLLENIRSRGLRVERMLPIHGRIVPFDDLVEAAKTSPPSSH